MVPSRREHQEYVNMSSIKEIGIQYTIIHSSLSSWTYVNVCTDKIYSWSPAFVTTSHGIFIRSRLVSLFYLLFWDLWWWHWNTSWNKDNDRVAWVRSLLHQWTVNHTHQTTFIAHCWHDQEASYPTISSPGTYPWLNGHPTQVKLNMLTSRIHDY